MAWSPDLDPVMAERFVQNAYRKIIDYRRWYGLVVKGQINIPQVYSTGTVAVTNGNNTVTGTGTTFTAAMVGRQFRVGLTNPIYTISAFNNATSLTLDMNWGGPTYASAGYSIFQQLVSLGANIKQVISVINLQLARKLLLNVPKQVLDAQDPWRSQIGFTRALVSTNPSADGQPQWELYPIPISQQAFPYLAYIQPPDLSDTNPYPYAFIRSDLIVLRAIPDALLFRGRENKYYDPNTARQKLMEFAQELEAMARVDDGYWLQRLEWKYGNDNPNVVGGGPDYAQSHDMDIDL